MLRFWDHEADYELPPRSSVPGVGTAPGSAVAQLVRTYLGSTEAILSRIAAASAGRTSIRQDRGASASA